MAILRMAAVGATFIALAAIVPAASRAQAPGARLQLVPGPDQARMIAHGGTNAQQAAAAPRLTSKSARAGARPTAANATASNTQRARVAIDKAAVRFIAMAEPILAHPDAAPRIFAQGNDGSNDDADDHVMRDGDSISLVGRLPWWRNDRMQPVTYGSAEAESKVLEAAAVWLAANGMAKATQPVSETVAPDESEDVEIADPGEVNDIDLAAEQESPPPQPTFLQSLLALVNGAASAIAATVRQLFD